jgi:predicted RNase H-like HicB family nuclease
MLKVNSYPAILEPTKEGFSVFFPDLPGAISAGRDYEDAVQQAEVCLSFHLYGMLQDKNKLPKPTHMAKLLKQLEGQEIAALIHPDIFAVKARQEDKSVRINITFPKSLLEAVDLKAHELNIDRSKLLQKAVREII